MEDEEEELLSIERNPEPGKAGPTVGIIDVDKLPLLSQILLLAIAGELQGKAKPVPQRKEGGGEDRRSFGFYETVEDKKEREKRLVQLEMRRNRKAKKKAQKGKTK